MRWALLAFALVGCAAETEPVDVRVHASVAVPAEKPALSNAWIVVIDPGMTEDHVDAVRGALLDWQARVGCGLSFEVKRGATLSFEQPPPPPGTIEVFEADTLPQADAIGFGVWYPNGGSRVGFLGHHDFVADFARVVRHELGHALHLGHDDRAPALMNTGGAGTGDIEAQDVADFDATWCGVRH